MEYEAMYDEFLNECNDLVVINGMAFEPARILKELDPIAYREGYLEYCDAMDLEDDEE